MTVAATSTFSPHLLAHIEAMALNLDDGNGTEQELAYILRAICIACVHEVRVGELYDAVDPLVGKWLDESTQRQVTA